MSKQLNTDQLDRLAEIKEEILVLLSEALDLVRGTPEEQRANHWFATFCTALDKDNTQGSELHNHHAGDHRCPEGEVQSLSFSRGRASVGAPHPGRLPLVFLWSNDTLPSPVS